MCMERRARGEKKELFKITARKSLFPSAWPQRDQFSILVSLPFVIWDNCMPIEMGNLAASVCLKRIVDRYFFQMNCFLDQFSMLQGERGENHKACSLKRAFTPVQLWLCPWFYISAQWGARSKLSRPLFHRSMNCHMTYWVQKSKCTRGNWMAWF